MSRTLFAIDNVDALQPDDGLVLKCGDKTGVVLPWRPGQETIVGPGGELGLHVVDPYDYQRPGADEVARRVMTHLEPG